MFTGIVTATGSILEAESVGDSRRLTVSNPTDWVLSMGESIALDGVCTTVAEIGDGRFSVDLLPETLLKSHLGTQKIGDPLNLERSATPTTLLGGHLVSGHVDVRGQVSAFVHHETWSQLIVCLPLQFAPLVTEKGSITLNGVSLTPIRVEMKMDEFEVEVHLVPYTLTNTTFGRLKAGDPINVEFDAIAKYVNHQLRQMHMEEKR